VTTLGATNPQYVRCIKPNSSKSSFLFEEELVLAQLRYSGMLETIRIRKAGYSVRVAFEQFLEKFKMLLSVVEGSNPKEQTLFLLKKLNIDNAHWQIGRTKIFMRNSVVFFFFFFFFIIIVFVFCFFFVFVFVFVFVFLFFVFFSLLISSSLLRALVPSSARCQGEVTEREGHCCLKGHCEQLL
jgi:hypothetical protein